MTQTPTLPHPTDLHRPSRFLHGGDYNPEQWLELPTVLAEDERLMQLARVNAVSIGIFSWSMLEPREGVFRFDWLDEAFARLDRAGVSIFLATPSGARPAWMSKAYPEVLRVQPDGGRNLHGARHNHCMSSPIFREKTAIINRELAQRYAGRPHLLGWHIGNEMAGDCSCALCVDAFRNWLHRRYQTLDALNDAWNTRFWSTVYNDWAEIDPPYGRGHWGLHGLSIAWRRFTSDQHVAFYRHEVAALRAAGATEPCTTNMHPGGILCIDGWSLGRAVDFVAWDNYPHWGRDADEAQAAAEAAFDFDLMRGLGGERPFIMMESTPSHVNWHNHTVQKPDGFALTTALQAVAHGSQAVLCFQWRKCRAGFEKHHGAFVDHAGHEHTRTFREATAVGSALEKLAPLLGSEVKSRVGLLCDWNNAFALAETMGLRNSQFRGKPGSYRAALIEHHRALSACGVTVDIVEPDGTSDWSRYAVLVAPLAPMLSERACQRIAAFTAAGGHVVSGYWLGQVDPEDRCRLGGFPGGGLGEVFGLWAEEWHSVPDHATFSVSGTAGIPGLDAAFACDQVIELLRLRGAEQLAAYHDGIYAGQPALTRHRHGTGLAWYQGCHLPLAQLSAWYAAVLATAGVKPLASLPSGVRIGCREDEAHRYLFLLNFSGHEHRLCLSGEDLLAGRPVGPEITLPACGCAVLRQARDSASTHDDHPHP